MYCTNCPSPRFSSAERHHLCGMVDVAVFSIIEKEDRAVLWFLNLEEVTIHWLPSSHSFKYGIFKNSYGQKIRVAIFRAGEAGNINMATLTSLVHAALLPRLSVLVGIAAGLKSGDLTDGENNRKVTGVKIGTVLVPREIVDYSFAAIKKVEDLVVEEIPLHKKHPVEKVGLAVYKHLTGSEVKELIARRNEYMKMENHDWRGQLDKESFPVPNKEDRSEWLSSLPLKVVDPSELVVTDDDVASSNLLLKNEEVLQKLHLYRHPRVKGGEMEAAGFAVASRTCNAEWLVIRAVSDLGDMAKSDLFQPYACASAAGYLAAVLRKLDLNLIRNSAADTLHRHLLGRAESAVKVVLDAFATIFHDQLGRKVNLEIYWNGEAKVVGNGGTRNVPGVIRHGNMKAERSGALNRFEPHRFFPFKPGQGMTRAVAQAADPVSALPEVFHLIQPSENTPLNWVYAVPLFENVSHVGERTGALCCTSTEPLFHEQATDAEIAKAKIGLKAIVGSVRDVVTSACISTGAFDLVLREVILDVEP